ncbi:MAG: DUF4982 domain-containing protein [Pirellulales bacterium]|nr:DUF4982 domain-containing protein [Pirellulales bacterium]
MSRKNWDSLTRLLQLNLKNSLLDTGMREVRAAFIRTAALAAIVFFMPLYAAMAVTDQSETAERKESFMQPATVFEVELEASGNAGAVRVGGMRRVRERIGFDFDWYFLKGDLWNHRTVGHTAAKRWRLVQVPHDWSTEYPLAESNASGPGGGFAETGLGWYRKLFVLPEFCRGKRIEIEFGGISTNSQVWINDQYLGRRPNGYVSFKYDLTEHLTYGEGQPNLLAVRVNNSAQPNSRWYTGSGIYRHVWLTITDKCYLDPWETFITTPIATKDKAEIITKTIVFNETEAERNVQLRTTVLDKSGEEVASSTGAMQLVKIGQTEFSQRMELASPHLWSVDDPYLYVVRNEIIEDGDVIDALDTNIGVRVLDFDVDTGFSLNGRPMKLKGVNLHHDAGCVGVAVPDRVAERRLEVIKSLGCNAVRLVKPRSGALMDICDRIGLMVYDEGYLDEWEYPRDEGGYHYHRHFKRWAQADMRDTVKRNRNHPSVILWSVGNELGDNVHKGKGKQNLEMLVSTVNQHDGTRPVTISGGSYHELLDVADFHYGGFLHFAQQPKRDKPIFGGETSHYGDPYFYANGHAHIIGQFLWAGADYLGETGVGSIDHSWWPSHATHVGLLDLCSFKKPRAYHRQALWSDEPVVYLVCETQNWAKRPMAFWGWPQVASHWNWESESEELNVRSYTNCDSVELFLNGVSLGEQRPSGDKSDYSLRQTSGPDMPRLIIDKPLWKVDFRAGVIRAVGKNGGKVVATHQLATAGKPSKIRLTPDRSTIAADGSDVCHVVVEVLDDKGTLVPSAQNLVSYKISGNGKIIGIGNGNQQSLESTRSNFRKVYKGRSLVIVQSRRQAGQISLVATTAGLAEAKIEIDSEEGYKRK